MVILCVIMISASGCGDMNASYDDNAAIARSGDSYSSKNASSIQIGGNLTVSATLTGTKTIWRYETKNETDVTLSYLLFVTNGGKAKLVLITPDDEVIILSESTDNTGNSEMQSQTVSLKPGNNRIKIVGYDAPKFNLELQISVGQMDW